jgi:asparagine synthase (glutamine-hydrolysing)
MSVIFGTCLSHDSVVDEKLLLHLANATARYGPDGTNTLAHGRIGMGAQAFHTHHRSRLEQPPSVDHRGNIVVLDGRLDNHRELAATQGMSEGALSDSALILKTFERWGEDCFSHLVGDWALALWSATDSVLYLACDHAGARTLFYRTLPGEIRWSTYLETFFVDDVPAELDQEYVAHLLSLQEIRDLTPYKGIRAVPPAHFIAFRQGTVTSHPHWHWIADTGLVYRSNTEYDDHYLHLFRQAVQRRTEPGAPVIAELSGGMDSSSIVCMADKIVSESHDQADQLDTVSYYDDTEPDWDERPYFTAVEKHRNKSGIHFDCSSRIPSYKPLILPDRIYPYPVGDRASIDNAIRFEQGIGAEKYRVILSGVGGDELLGGVPTPFPELADYLRAGKLFKLLTKAGEWCVVSRQPLFQMLNSTALFTGHLYGPSHVNSDTVPPWLSSELRQICLQAPPRLAGIRDLFTARPSALVNGKVWWSVLDALPHLSPKLMGCYEYRYPYLDRDLVEFLHRIPREQLVQPGRRRLLMRRALKDIVPTEILERKRKAFVSRGPITHLRNARQEIEHLFSNSVLVNHDLIDRDKFLQTFRSELAGAWKWLGHLNRTIDVELWLQSLRAQQAKVSFAAPDRRNHNEFLPGVYRANKLRESNAAH